MRGGDFSKRCIHHLCFCFCFRLCQQYGVLPSRIVQKNLIFEMNLELPGHEKDHLIFAIDLINKQEMIASSSSPFAFDKEKMNKCYESILFSRNKLQRENFSTMVYPSSASAPILKQEENDVHTKITSDGFQYQCKVTQQTEQVLCDLCRNATLKLFNLQYYKNQDQFCREHNFCNHCANLIAAHSKNCTCWDLLNVKCKPL
jgi:hypothetical protein